MKIVLRCGAIGALVLGIGAFVFVFVISRSQFSFHGPPDLLIACIYAVGGAAVGFVIGAVVGVVVREFKR